MSIKSVVVIVVIGIVVAVVVVVDVVVVDELVVVEVLVGVVDGLLHLVASLAENCWEEGG